jgi:hypothetical protein
MWRFKAAFAREPWHSDAIHRVDTRVHSVMACRVSLYALEDIPRIRCVIRPWRRMRKMDGLTGQLDNGDAAWRLLGQPTPLSVSGAVFTVSCA